MYTIFRAGRLEYELKEELTRTGRLMIRYAPSAKAQDAQWAYVGRDLFYYGCQKLSFCALYDPFIKLKAIKHKLKFFIL